MTSAVAPRRPRRRRPRAVNRKPARATALFLGFLPFLLIVVVYAIASGNRLADNPADKLLPSLSSMAQAFWTMAAVPDVRTGELLLWVDTAASLTRLAIGVGISAFLALCHGIAIGFLPFARAVLAPVVAAISLIPPLAILPILFI
ncbi:MAG: ABC transporter permease, partial [Bauldia sp.]